MADQTTTPAVLDPDSADAAGKATLFDELMQDPEVRESTLRALSKKHPDVYLPEIRVADKVNERVGAIEKRLNDEAEARKREELQTKLGAQKAEATKGLDDDGVKALEKLMVEKGIGNYHTARELYDFQSKVATPSVLPSRRQPSMPSALKDIQTNPQKWARNQAYEALDDLARQREAQERA